MIARREEVRKRLEGERERLLRELEQLKTMTSALGERLNNEHGGYGNHLADDATETFELEKSLTLEKNLHQLLAKVEHALRKEELGTYGLCDACGMPIAPDRLEALPYASLCIDCKVRQEKHGKEGWSWR